MLGGYSCRFSRIGREMGMLELLDPDGGAHMSGNVSNTWLAHAVLLRLFSDVVCIDVTTTYRIQ